jgi:hypothetical protein
MNSWGCIYAITVPLLAIDWPTTVGLLGAIFTPLLTACLGYYFGKRSKIDDLRIKRRHELAEQLSIAIQKDHKTRENLMQGYKSNFEHLDEMRAIEAFEKHPNLYSTMRQQIEQLSESGSQISELGQQGAIYFDVSLPELIDTYNEATNFSFSTDGCGGIFFDTYNQAFFSNLLNSERIEIRRRTFKAIMKNLRDMKH